MRVYDGEAQETDAEYTRGTTMAISTHPSDARYYSSRAAARAARRHGERVIRLGSFQGGSFGCYPRMLDTGRYVGQYAGPGGLGQIPPVTVWMVTSR